MRRVIIESPFKGDREKNAAYLKECVLDCLARGESPYASHAFFTQFLDDDDPEERMAGIEAGLVWGDAADAVVVYVDLGISSGMGYGIRAALAKGKTIEYRSLKPGCDQAVIFPDQTVPLASLARPERLELPTS